MNCLGMHFVELSSEILGKGNYFRFRARGGSMFPFIRDGDVLKVKSASVPEIRLGDVVFYRRLNRMVAHRVIKKVSEDGKSFLVTKGDSSIYPDQPVRSEDLLGKVVTVERSGLVLRLDSRLARLTNLLWARISPFSGYLYIPGRRIKRKIRRIFGGLLPYIQGLKLYRKLGKKLIRNEICYSMAVPEDSLSLFRLYRYDEHSDIRHSAESLGEHLYKPDDSQFCLVARIRGKVVGSITLKRMSGTDSSKYEGWWLFGLQVSWPYRGIGIGAKLTKMGCERAVRNGAFSVRLLAFKKDKPAINLYRKLGFRQVSIPAIDAQLEEDVKRGMRRRVIMEKL